MPDLVRVLMVEDVADDAALIERELRRAGITGAARRVDSERGYREALQTFATDIILTDHSLPTFGAADALRIALLAAPDTPVIVVTGSLDEETAAEYIKAGAADYVVKHHLERVGPAVLRALDLRRARAEQARAEEARRQGGGRFRPLIEPGADVVALVAPDGTLLFASHSIERLLGRGEAQQALDGVAGEQQGPVGGDEGDDVRAGLDQRAKAPPALAPGFFRAGLLGPRAPQVEGAQHGGAHALEVVLDDVVRGARLDILRRRFFVEAAGHDDDGRIRGCEERDAERVGRPERGERVVRQNDVGGEGLQRLPVRAFGVDAARCPGDAGAAQLSLDQRRVVRDVLDHQDAHEIRHRISAAARSRATSRARRRRRRARRPRNPPA